MGIVSVLVDSREPAWCQQLRFGGVPTMVTMLNAGDVMVSCDDGNVLIVERKTAGDLLNTLRDDRLFPQVAKLRETSPYAYLLICGTLHPGPQGHCVTDERESGWNWDAVQGALLTVQELGVHVVQVASDLDFEASVIRLANRDRGAQRILPVRDMSIIGEGEAILSSLPGIGAEKAGALLAAFDSAHLALHYLTVWERHWHHKKVVPGIGDGTRRRVRRALGLTDGIYLAAGLFHDNEEGENERDASTDTAAGTNDVNLGDDISNRSGDAPIEAVRSELA